MQLSSYNTPEKRMVYYEEKILTLKAEAIKQYNELEIEAQNINYLYAFNQKVDKLAGTIIEIFYFIEMKNMYRPEQPQRPTKSAYEEIAEEKRDNLIIKRAASEKTLSLIDQTISAIKGNDYFLRLHNKLEMERLRTVLYLEEIKTELRVYEEEPDLTDDEIAIYLTEDENSISFKGQIFLLNSPICIGNIEYRGINNIAWLGDIGYNINQAFRGHNYAHKALELIKTKILARGIDKVIITCDCDNIASQKTIEKFGGKRIDCSLAHIYRYECDLSLKLENTPKQRL